MVFSCQMIMHRDFFFALLFAKSRYMPNTAWKILWSMAVPGHCGDDDELKTWHLSPAMSPPSLLTKDWCIIVKTFVNIYIFSVPP